MKAQWKSLTLTHESDTEPLNFTRFLSIVCSVLVRSRLTPRDCLGIIVEEW
jgi:hypothetical protein